MAMATVASGRASLAEIEATRAGRPPTPPSDIAWARSRSRTPARPSRSRCRAAALSPSASRVGQRLSALSPAPVHERRGVRVLAGQREAEAVVDQAESPGVRVPARCRGGGPAARRVRRRTRPRSTARARRRTRTGTAAEGDLPQTHAWARDLWKPGFRASAALARAAANEQDATLFLAAAWTGLRQGELLALRWRDLDFTGQRVHVRRAWSQAAKVEKAPKLGKVRSVPLVDELAGPLDGLSRREHFTGDDDLVFCNNVGEHLDAWALRRRYEAALERAGLRRVRFHDLRHCFGSVAVRAFPPSDVQAMLGHAHVTTTIRYVHHRPGADDAAKLSSAFRGESVPRAVPRNGEIKGNSAQLSDTESTL